jgi:DNA invertase Pin-like site-specific DNA recombinase
MRKAVGYIRVSTRHQEKQGCGLLAQEAAIEAFANRQPLMNQS